MIGSKIPTPEEIVILAQPLLKAIIKVGKPLKDVKAKWAVGGDAGEVMMGVNIQKADHVEIITTKDGCHEICTILSQYVTTPPAQAEKKLPREADVEGKILPVYVRSEYAELTVDGARVEVYGNEQIRVGEWEWGDPLDFEPEAIYVVGVRVPVVPLRLKSELALGLGWLDRVQLITDAVIRSKHRH